MKKNVEKSFLEAGLYLSYMNYYATGEGLRSCIAVGSSAAHAEKLLKNKLHDYFHAAIVTGRIEANANSEIMKMIGSVPSKVKAALAEMPLGAGEFYSEFYYNLA